MAQQLLAWVVWDLLSGVLVMLVLLAPFLGLGAAVYLVVQWRKGDGDAGAPPEAGRRAGPPERDRETPA